MRNVTYYFPSSYTWGEVRQFILERGMDFGRFRLIFEGVGQYQYAGELQGSEQHERTTDPMG